MGWYNEHKFVSVLCTHWSWWWVWWWKWRGGGWRWNSKRLPHPLYPPPFLDPPIIFIPSSYIQRIFFISPSYPIRCGLWWWSGNGSRWDVGDVSDRSIWGARQAAPRWNGLGWNGSTAKKYFFFAAVALQTTCICQGGGLNPTQVTIETVSWIGPNLFPFLCQSPFYFGKSCSRTYPSQSISALVLPQEAVSVPRKMKPFVSCTPGRDFKWAFSCVKEGVKACQDALWHLCTVNAGRGVPIESK